MWFQALFHSPPGGAFHLSLTVLVRYRSHESLSPWRVVPPASRPIPRVGRYSGTPLGAAPNRHLPGCHRLWRPVPGDFGWLRHDPSVGPTTPGDQSPPVWAGPVSLAATPGISFDFSSSGYLDVSVPQVRFPFGMTALARRRVAPFGHLGITACVTLPRAYRSLPRPSSPPCAQAFPTCLLSLDSIIRQVQIRAISRVSNCHVCREARMERIASLRCVDPRSQRSRGLSLALEPSRPSRSISTITLSISCQTAVLQTDDGRRRDGGTPPSPIFHRIGM